MERKSVFLVLFGVDYEGENVTDVCGDMEAAVKAAEIQRKENRPGKEWKVRLPDKICPGVESRLKVRWKTGDLTVSIEEWRVTDSEPESLAPFGPCFRGC
jgi:hypothetical protein